MPTLKEPGMCIIECEIPSDSALGQDRIDSAYFRDCCQVPLARRQLGIVEIYAAILGHAPPLLKVLLIVRNAIVRPFGLNAPAASDILRREFKMGHTVGDTIGRWRIFFISDNEIITGADDKHQDFRVSVLRVQTEATANVVVTTICNVHNSFGKVYLFFVIPFHRYGVRKLMSNAVAAQRV
jgi:hypothetical protein